MLHTITTSIACNNSHLNFSDISFLPAVKIPKCYNIKYASHALFSYIAVLLVNAFGLMIYPFPYYITK
jgi:hypothetical protein